MLPLAGAGYELDGTCLSSVLTASSVIALAVSRGLPRADGSCWRLPPTPAQAPSGLHCHGVRLQQYPHSKRHCHDLFAVPPLWHPLQHPRWFFSVSLPCSLSTC
jgi:hypothetical protein